MSNCNENCGQNTIVIPGTLLPTSVQKTPQQLRLEELFGDRIQEIPEVPEIIEEMIRLDYLNRTVEQEEFQGLPIKIEQIDNDSESTSSILPETETVLEVVVSEDAFNQAVEEMTDIIAQESPFVNPISSSCDITASYLDGFGNSYDSASLFSLATSQYASNPIGSIPSESEFDTFFTYVNNLKNTIQQLKAHTDIFSGVNLAVDKNIVYMAKVVIDSRRNKGFEGCGITGKLFGAINKAQEYLNEFQSLLSDFSKFLDHIPSSFAQLKQKLIDIAANILFQIQQDLATLAEIELRSFQKQIANAITQLFDDECLGDIVTTITTPKIQEAVKTVKDVRII